VKLSQALDSPTNMWLNLGLQYVENAITLAIIVAQNVVALWP
jgi:hypothetical protein